MNKMGTNANYNEDYINFRFNVIEKATELGRVLIDTSPIYGNGFSESETSKIISRLKKKLFIATKYYPENKHKKEDVLDSIKKSISRLKAQEIDLLQVHWPNWLANSEEVCEGLIKAKELGLISSVGICNFSGREITEFLKSNDLSLVSNQIELNLLNINDYEKTSSNLVEILYGCLLQGRLSDISNQETLNALSNDYGIKPSVLTIAYLLKKSYPSVCISKVSSIEHLSDLTQALELNLEASLEKELASLKTDTLFIDPSKIILKGDSCRNPYLTFEDAIYNKLDLFPSPLSLAVRILKYDLVLPVKVLRNGDLFSIDGYDPFDQIKKFWGWRIAFPDSKVPIKVIS